MSSTAVRRLTDVRMSDAAEVGGKAASLGELLAAGVRVPDAVVLTVGAADVTADERRSLLRAAVDDLGVGTFAVRSSGIAEDGAERSYAGMYESVLDVPRRAIETGPICSSNVSARTTSSHCRTMTAAIAPSPITV